MRWKKADYSLPLKAASTRRKMEQCFEYLSGANFSCPRWFKVYYIIGLTMRGTLSTLRALAIVIAVADGVLLAAVSWWLLNGGVIACGRGLFDGPNWPFMFFVLWVVPAAVLASAIALARYCTRRLAYR